MELFSLNHLSIYLSISYIFIVIFTFKQEHLNFKVTVTDLFELQFILISLHSNLNRNSVSCSQTIQIQELKGGVCFRKRVGPSTKTNL